MEYKVLKKRYIGLDIIRIISAFVICMFHTTIHLDCDYGVFMGISKMGAVFMTMFFMLSGFSLFVNWAGDDLTEIKQVRRFLKKRFFGIVPMYYVAGLVFVIFTLVTGKETALDVAILAPIEIVGLQSVFSSLSKYTHNGGTWFISCLLICYFLYPFFQEVIKRLNKKTRIISFMFCVFLLLYAPFVVFLYKLNSIYSNPFFRLVEFVMGVILAAMILDFKEKESRYIYNWITIFFANLIMIIGISMGVALNIGVGNYMLYSWVYIPCFVTILIGSSGVKSKFLEKSKLIKLMSQATFVFFLAQLYSNQISKMIINKYELENNYVRILIGWSICIILTVVLRLIEITLNRLFKKYGLLQ